MIAGRPIGEIIKVVNRSFLLVLIAAIGSTSILDGRWIYISLAGMVVAIMLDLIICARIVAHLERQKRFSVTTMIRNNWRNYLVVIVLLAIPALTYHWLSRQLGSGTSLWIREGIEASVAVVSIYVLPIVFLRNVGFVAIPAGITYLSRSLRASSPMVAIALLASAIGTARYLMLGIVPLPWLALPVLGIGVVVAYLHFVVFAAASDVLIHGKESNPSVA